MKLAGLIDVRAGRVWLAGVVLPCRAVAVLALSVFLLAGCSGSGGGSDAGAAAYDHVYTVRARVTRLPDGSPSGDFRARHEAIPDYQAANGSVGMNTMEMPFQIVDAGVLDGVAVGDIVEITYGETHRPRVSQGVIAIKQLPNDTVLDFGEVTP